MAKKNGDKGSTASPLTSFLAGGIAGGVEAGATYPLEFAKTRVQLRNKSGLPTPRNPFLVVTQVVQEEGAKALYKGCSAQIYGSIAKDAVRFLSFDLIKSRFADPETGTLTPARNLLAGLLTGIVASTFAVTPAERMKTALIDDARSEKRFRSLPHAVQVITREGGIGGIYRGYAGTTLKQAGATACRLGVYNILKDFESQRGIRQDGPVTNFANGAIAGVTTTYATMPFDTIKTRAQSARGTSTIEATKSIMSDTGIKGFWRGSTMRLSRLVFSGGILFTVYEATVRILKPIID